MHDRFSTSVFAHQSHAPGSDDKLMFITQTSFGTTEEESLGRPRHPAASRKGHHDNP